MVSRVGLLTVVLALAGVAATGSAARTPATGTAMFLAQNDARLCPSPLCGGYWVALANGVRTRCGSGERRARCYAADAVDRSRRPVGGLKEGALLRGALERGRVVGARRLDRFVVSAQYVPAGTATPGGGWYRVFDTGIVCVRAPCFSFRAQSVNAATRITVSSVALEASGATPSELERAAAALRTKDGLYARGRFASTPDGGRAFRALRLYLRAPLPRA
jgi:hypothetical protein